MDGQHPNWCVIKIHLPYWVSLLLTSSWADATEDELHAFLSKPDSLNPTPPEQAGGSGAYVPFCSIFLMAKSNCAFVNYNSKEELLRAVQQFHGRRLRPNMRVRLVCRIRTKEKGEQQTPKEHSVIPLGCVASNIRMRDLASMPTWSIVYHLITWMILFPPQMVPKGSLF